MHYRIQGTTTWVAISSLWKVDLLDLLQIRIEILEGQAFPVWMMCYSFRPPCEISMSLGIFGRSV